MRFTRRQHRFLTRVSSLYRFSLKSVWAVLGAEVAVTPRNSATIAVDCVYYRKLRSQALSLDGLIFEVMNLLLATPLSVPSFAMSR